MNPDITVAMPHIGDIKDHEAYVRAVRELNDGGVAVPWAWSVAVGPRDPLSVEQEALTFGVHNDVGALVWTSRDAEWVPESGMNPGWLEYFLAGMDESPIPPFAEVPVAVVFEALVEFLRTSARPECVRWRHAAPAESMVSDRGTARP